jgi:MoxR-like ATPase
MSLITRIIKGIATLRSECTEMDLDTDTDTNTEMGIHDASERCDAVLDTVLRAVVADRTTMETVLSALLARGNVLLEDVPGTGKTLTARSFATALGLSFSRIQFTPDLLPADLTGSYVFDDRTGEFEFNPGPVFSNVVLADEINRASPKTQAALLEAMEEGQVTVEGETHPLPSPFFVIATQNPVDEGQGTFPLPEAQKDRFLVKTSIGYPAAEGERELLDRRADRSARYPSAERQLASDAIGRMQRVVEAVRVAPDIRDYIVDLTRETRADDRVQHGVSPRGTQRLFESTRARAVLANRSYVTPDDVKAATHPVLDHRVVLTPNARVEELSGADVVEDVVDRTPVPTVDRVNSR